MSGHKGEKLVKNWLNCERNEIIITVQKEREKDWGNVRLDTLHFSSLRVTLDSYFYSGTGSLKLDKNFLLVTSPLPHPLKQQNRSRHRRIQRLGPAGHRDDDTLVD